MSDYIKYCVYCGARVSEEAYCPKCGKLIIKVKPRIESYTSLEPIELFRKCTGCGSIINSNVLDQCPVCNTRLAPVPEHIKEAQKQTGFVLTNKKLKLEKNLVLKDDKWNLKEGVNVFSNSLMIYIIFQLLLVMFLLYSTNSPDSMNTFIELNIYTLLLSQLPGVIYGFFVIWYISTKNHKIEKIGFSKDKKQIPLALILGICGGFALIGIHFLMAYVNQMLVENGLKIFDLSGYSNRESKVLQEAEIIWIFILFIMLILAVISTEIVFRGVLHNTLKERFGTKPIDKIKTIFIVALAYALICLIFSFPFGLVFFLMNILVFIVLGILYEVNDNLLYSIIASIFYNLLLISLIIFL